MADKAKVWVGITKVGRTPGCCLDLHSSLTILVLDWQLPQPPGDRRCSERLPGPGGRGGAGRAGVHRGPQPRRHHAGDLHRGDGGGDKMVTSAANRLTGEVVQSR